MPAVRQVAKEHGINPNTVQKVYKMLEQNGLIYTVPQKGSYVKDEGAVNAIREAVKEFGEAVDTALKKNVTPEQMRNVIEERCENND
jgi:GntR family transcriptional regulator